MLAVCHPLYKAEKPSDRRIVLLGFSATRLHLVREVSQDRPVVRIAIFPVYLKIPVAAAKKCGILRFLIQQVDLALSWCWVVVHFPHRVVDYLHYQKYSLGLNLCCFAAPSSFSALSKESHQGRTDTSDLDMIILASKKFKTFIMDDYFKPIKYFNQV